MFISKSEYEDLKDKVADIDYLKRECLRVGRLEDELSQSQLTVSRLKTGLNSIRTDLRESHSYNRKLQNKIMELEGKRPCQDGFKRAEIVSLKAQKEKIEARLAKLDAESCPESQLTVGMIDPDKLHNTVYRGTGNPDSPHAGDMWYRCATATQDSGVFKYTKYGDWVAYSDERKYVMRCGGNAYLGLANVGTPEETLVSIHHPYPMTMEQISKHFTEECSFQAKLINEEKFYEN